MLGILELTEEEQPRTFDEADQVLARRMAALAGIAPRALVYLPA